MLEVAVGLVVFMVAMMLVMDVGWLLYSYNNIVQATKATARRAGANRFSRTELREFFFRSCGPSLVSSTDSSITQFQVTTRALDANYASLEAMSGTPSVEVLVTHRHAYLAPFPWNFSSTYEIRASGRSMVSTWPQVASVTF
jgi:Flp pilus assembly protein TadG